MRNYALDNYKLSSSELLQSLFVSEYGLRHWALSNKQTSHKWGHRIIAVIELCPVIGLIATVIEALVVSCICPNKAKLSSQKREWLFLGSQVGCNGPVSVAKVEAIRAKLDARRSTGIQFNPKKTGPILLGGTCTAMALEFLELYFKARKISIKQPDAQSDMLVHRLIKLGPKFSSSSQKMRNRQAAYNTIEVQSNDSTIDYSKNKVQSLANYHSFVIDYSSSVIDIERADECSIVKEVDALPEGAFFIRILKSENNEKLESSGHSLVYIKEGGLGLFFDPNYGVRNLTSSGHSKILFEGLKDCFRSFKVNQARFYRLQELPLPL